MATTDPLLNAVRAIYLICLQDIRESIEGMDLDGLHWRPAGAETNTPAILVTHALGSFRDWTCIGLGAERPPRSRDDEFVSRFDTIEAASSYINAVAEDTLRVLDTVTAPDWAEICWAELPGEPTPTRAYALIHAIEHLREHVGHLQLTRQLWGRASIASHGQHEKEGGLRASLFVF